MGPSPSPCFKVTYSGFTAFGLCPWDVANLLSISYCVSHENVLPGSAVGAELTDSPAVVSPDPPPHSHPGCPPVGCSSKGLITVTILTQAHSSRL